MVMVGFRVRVVVVIVVMTARVNRGRRGVVAVMTEKGRRFKRWMPDELGSPGWTEDKNRLVGWCLLGWKFGSQSCWLA
jgi:hypothetical protein